VAHAELLAFQGSGGTGGVGGYGWCGPNGSPGAPGIPLRLEQQATASTLPFAPRRLDAPGLWRGGVPVTLTVEGAPGDVAVLVASPTTGFHFLPSRKGVALLGGGMLALVPLGRLDASGRLQATFAPFGPIPPAEGIVRRLQAWTASATTGAHLTGPLTVALVDPAF